MSQKNADLVASAYRAFAAGDLAPVLQIADPECEVIEPPGMPDRQTYRGHAGLLEALGHWPSQFEEFRTEVVRLIDAGDTVISLARHTGRGKTSGVEVEALIANVHVFRNGRMVRWQMLPSLDAALAVAGLSDEEAGARDALAGRPPRGGQAPLE